MPDARLPSERELASLFGVGRPAVREAIGALQNEGLVITRRNSGTYVAGNAPDVLSRSVDVAQAPDGQLQPDYSPSATLDVRLILEPAIARRAAALKKRDKLAEHYLSQMETLTDVSDPEQRTLWNNSDRLFHRQLAQMTGDALLARRRAKESCHQKRSKVVNTRFCVSHTTFFGHRSLEAFQGPPLPPEPASYRTRSSTPRQKLPAMRL
ncbi:FCD domain-containing protein [Paraburkholderia aspalathi]|uniref:FCD domain-containing protein n=2 Tax=Paraburkholderia aspalathi TaxID=1324617 RepID=A0A1I7ELW0_9BURK|nr:FCD domain-containing protein [Paraburkholderia aspalathi]